MSEHLFSSQVKTWFFGGIAQLGEHLPCKQGVSGSIPLTSTTPYGEAQSAWTETLLPNEQNLIKNGNIAQLVRAHAW